MNLRNGVFINIYAGVDGFKTFRREIPRAYIFSRGSGRPFYVCPRATLALTSRTPTTPLNSNLLRFPCSLTRMWGMETRKWCQIHTALTRRKGIMGRSLPTS